MSNKPQRPKLELPTNIPVHVEIKYPPYNGEGKDYGYGLTYKYTVIQDGVEKTWFVGERLYPEVKDFGKGDKIVITKKEEKNAQTGKTYDRIVVMPEFFDEHGRISEPPKPSIESPEGIEAYRRKIKNALVMAYEDVDAVKMHFAEKWQDKAEAERVFTPDVCQKLATSVLIDYLKRS